jgi:ADP-ribosyl-[dinitrogen reductase] hydrolase
MEYRIKGSIYGMAIGDALGAPVEFNHRGTFEPVHDFEDGAFGGLLSAGDWTDDTSMALCLGTSLIKQEKFDAKDQMERYAKWYKEGYMSVIDHCFDIGNTTRKALEEFDSNDRSDPFMGSTHPRSAGNGSLMRLCPVPIFFRDDIELAGNFSAESSKTTHAAEETVEACRVYGRMIAAAVNELINPEDFKSKNSRNILQLLFQDIIDSLPDKVRAIVNGSYIDKQEEEILSSGYVIHSMEAALWAIANSNSFQEGVLKAVNLGDDADTVAAIYGQLAGALYGFDGIPKKWIEGISQPKTLDEVVSGLITVPQSLDIAEDAYNKRIESFKIHFNEKARNTPKRCWWIEAGKVLGGPFPGSQDHAKAKVKMSDLLDIGVVAFVDLMEDGEFNFKSESEYDPYSGMLENLADERGMKITRKQFHVRDQDVPQSNETMMDILNFINSFVEKGQLVYVHCAGGHGRTGTVAGCWLMCRGLADGCDFALKTIEFARQHDEYLAGHDSPENENQIQFLKEWGECMSLGTGRTLLSCEYVRELEKKIPHFENVDMKCPLVFHNVEKSAIEFGSYGQQHIPYLRSWACCDDKNCNHTSYTGWATSPKGVAHFRSGRLHGECYAWERTKWHGSQISDLGNFFSIGRFEDGKLIKKINFGNENYVNFSINHNIGHPSSFSLFCNQREPWLKFCNARHPRTPLSDEYVFNYEEDEENYILNYFIKRKAVSIFYSEYFFDYLSLNQRLRITGILKNLQGQIDYPEPIEPDLIPKDCPGENPFRWIITFERDFD